MLLLLLLASIGAVAWLWSDREPPVGERADSAGPAAIGGVSPALHGNTAALGTAISDGASARSAIAANRPTRGRGSLSVLVRLDDGAPLPAVAVQVTARDGRQQHVTERVVVTGDDGAASFDGLDAGPWRVRLDRNVEAEVSIEAEARAEHTFTVKPGVSALARVLDGNGQRIAGAVVTLWPAGGVLDAPAAGPGADVGSTDSNGELLLRGLPSFGRHGCWLAARHPAFGWSVARMVRAAGDEQDTETRVVELRLGLGGAFVTVTIQNEAHDPLVSASVELTPVDRPGSRDDGDSRVLRHLQRSARTDVQGRAVLGPLPPCDYRLDVTCGGYESFRAPLRIDDELPQSRTVVLAKEARVHARIVTADGAPVAGADFRVQVEPRGGRVSSGPDGRCELGGLSPGSGAFVATHPEFQPAHGAVELARGSTTELQVALVALPAIRGRVVDDADQPLVGFGVRFTADLPGDDEDQRSVVSAAHGGFGTPARNGLDYRLQVYEPGTWIPLQGIEPARVIARDEPWLVRVPRQVRASAYVAGTLVDGDGRPALAGQHLAVRGDGFVVHAGNTMAAPSLDVATGQFRLGPLPPGEYTLLFRGQPSFPVPGVVLRANATTQLGQVIVPATGTLRIEVTAAAGLRTDDVMVQVDGDGDSDIFKIDGTLTGSRLLLPGRYRVVVYGTGFRWLEQDLEITAGQVATVRGELRPAVRVGLRFCMPDGERGAVFTITDGTGAVACRHELEDGVASEDLWPFFEIGSFDVAITGSSGRRYHTRFAVTSFEFSAEVRELRGELVR